MKVHRRTLLWLAPLVALAAAAVASGSGSGNRSINAIAKATGITFVDADHSGKPSAGDYEIGTSNYVSSKSGKPIGRGSVVCTQLDESGVVYQCQGLARFAGGDLVTAGRFSPTAKTGSLAITGGTGVYAGVRGLQTLTWLDKNYARAKVTFALES